LNDRIDSLENPFIKNQSEKPETLSRTIEMDEAVLGGKRPGKRGWSAGGKNIVFGIYQRNGKA
jgi:transposase